jgi:hypothetical protein
VREWDTRAGTIELAIFPLRDLPAQLTGPDAAATLVVHRKGDSGSLTHPAPPAPAARGPGHGPDPRRQIAHYVGSSATSTSTSPSAAA